MRVADLVPAFLIGTCFIAPVAKAAGPNPLLTPADSCGPSYTDIYDFLVGDVFQYSESHREVGGGIGGNAEEDRKYTILSKEAQPGGYRYQVKGLIRSWYFAPGNNQHFASINPTWLFTDSLARRSLNACQEQVVKMLADSYPPGSPRATGFYTRVHIAIGDTFDVHFLADTTHVKYFGAPVFSQYPNNNLFIDSAGKVLLGEQGPIENGPIAYLEAYAAGLGIIHSETLQFESNPTISLTGYIRNGVTHGKVESDSAFGVTVAIRLTPEDNRIDPRGPGFIDASGRFLLSTQGPGMEDLLGRRARAIPSLALPLAKSR